jgi:Flp pilus assembly CpaF family ATPase
VRAIREQMASAVDLICQQERMRDAARAEAARMREGIMKAILEIEDAGPKAMKNAVQDLKAALAKEPGA